MRRREFITLLGGAAAAWPLVARAQQPEQMRRIGVIFGGTASDPDIQARLTAFLQVLQQLGWTEGRNVRIESRWGAGNADNTRKYAAELVALTPDVILANGDVAAALLLQATRTVPIVFVIVPDPVGAGLANSLSRPGGNATGFMQFEYSLTAKWPELLKEIAPGVKRAAVLRDAASTSGIGQFAVIQYVAPSVGMEVSPIDLRDPGEIERAVTAFARSPDGGLILTAGCVIGGSSQSDHYACGPAQAACGLLQRGLCHRRRADLLWTQFRRPVPARSGLRRSHTQGEKPADMPVQAPTKYELVVNLKTAKALGLAIPATVLARADEVIDDKAAHVHHAARHRGGGVAACGAGAAAVASDRLTRRFSPAGGADTLEAFRQGLSDTGFFEHQNVGIEYRWAEGRYDRLPAMAADLVRRQVALILTTPTAGALAAKAATTTIPIVFMIAGDPVQIGLVPSLGRPGGNLTGATFYVAQLVSRQLAVLHELLPGATTIGVLVNPSSPANVEPQVRDLRTGANALGLRLHVANAASEREAEVAFATLTSTPVEALFITSDGHLQPAAPGTTGRACSSVPAPHVL